MNFCCSWLSAIIGGGIQVMAYNCNIICNGYCLISEINGNKIRFSAYNIFNQLFLSFYMTA